MYMAAPNPRFESDAAVVAQMSAQGRAPLPER